MIDYASVTGTFLWQAQGTEDPPILDRLFELWVAFQRSLPRLGFAALVVLATWGIAAFARRLVRRALRRSRMRRSLQDLFGQIVTAGVWVGGIAVAAIVVFPTLTLGKAVAALGIGSIAIGFAFKDIFENFFAGVLILWRFPFENGDFIRCGDLMGAVEETTIRMTLIRRVDGQLVVVPNSELLKNPVEVLTDLDHRRAEITCGVAYDTDLDAAREVIREAVEQSPHTREEPAVQVFAKEFSSSSVDFQVTWWSGSRPVDERQARDDVVSRIKASLDKAGIEIPFPYRTLTFKEPLRTEIHGALGGDQ